MSAASRERERTEKKRSARTGAGVRDEVDIGTGLSKGGRTRGDGRERKRCGGRGNECTGQSGACIPFIDQASTKRSERMTHNQRKPNEESVKSRRWRTIFKPERISQCEDLNESKGKTALVRKGHGPFKIGPKLGGQFLEGPGDIAAETQARTVMRVVDHLDLRPLHLLFGHSRGIGSDERGPGLDRRLLRRPTGSKRFKGARAGPAESLRSRMELNTASTIHGDRGAPQGERGSQRPA